MDRLWVCPGHGRWNRGRKIEVFVLIDFYYWIGRRVMHCGMLMAAETCDRPVARGDTERKVAVMVQDTCGGVERREIGEIGEGKGEGNRSVGASERAGGGQSKAPQHRFGKRSKDCDMWKRVVWVWCLVSDLKINPSVDLVSSILSPQLVQLVQLVFLFPLCSALRVTAWILQRG